MSIVPESGRDGEWQSKSISVNRLPGALSRLVWGRTPAPSNLSEAQKRRLRRANLALSGQRKQKRRSSCDSGHSQPGALHGLLNRSLVGPHPGVFGIVLRRRVEHREAFRGFGGFAQSHLQNFGEVERLAIGFLRDLLAATEPVGDDEPVGGSLADGGQKFEFANGFRNLVFVLLEAERYGRAYAAAQRRGE